MREPLYKVREPDQPHARHMCCSEHGVFVELADGSMWWRRHEWPSDAWQPVIPPGQTATRKHTGASFTPGKPKPTVGKKQR